ncbi:hypothetical protein MASR2M78_10270 [Treponema sp.]
MKYPYLAPTFFVLILSSCTVKSGIGSLSIASADTRIISTSFLPAGEVENVDLTELRKPLALLGSEGGLEKLRGFDLIQDEIDFSFYTVQNKKLLTRIGKPFSSFSSFHSREAFPVAASYYALWYDAEVLEGLGITVPASWDELINLVPALKQKDLQALSVSAMNGWPLALWFAYADIRLNGSAAYQERLEGKRSFSEAVNALEELIRLYDQGAIAPNSGQKTWVDSWDELMEGRALFCLLPSFVVDRIPSNRRIAALRVPVARGQGRGELSIVSAFFIPVSSRNPGGARSFVREYVRQGAPQLADGRSRLSLIIPGNRADRALSPGQRILDGADRLLLPPDRGLSPQFSYDAMLLFAELARNLDEGKPVKASEYCQRLEGLR